MKQVLCVIEVSCISSGRVAYPPLSHIAIVHVLYKIVVQFRMQPNVQIPSLYKLLGN